jgi:hypothetical protein
MRIRSLAAGLALLLAITAGSLTAVARPAAADDPHICTFTMLKLHAYNLRSDSHSDFVWLQIGDSWYPRGNDGVEFWKDGITQYWNKFDDPHVGFGDYGITIKLVLDLWPSNHVVQNVWIDCGPETNAELYFDDNDALYMLTYSVQSAPIQS